MLWTFPYFSETKDLTESTRTNAPGRFVGLADGCTHYELGGPPDGKVVVFVHGFSVPYFIWDPTFTFLAESGFRVLRYDLLGRGFSDRPNRRYNVDLFCKQLRELLDTLGIKDVNLIGLSMGGPISATFTARFPVAVRKLVLIDPAGIRPVTISRVLKAATTPGFGELALGLLGSRRLSRAVESDFYDPAQVKTFVAKYMAQMEYKGFMRSLLSTIRNGMLGDFSATYRQIGRVGTPTLLFWGRDDKTVPFKYSEDMIELIPQAEFHAFERCGHIPHYEKPAEANPLLLEFLI